MDVSEIQEGETLNLQKSTNNPQLVSIRKKLAAPNNILPGTMLRSQQPYHILPIKIDFQSQPGSQMPLDEIPFDQSIDIIQKNKAFRSKNMFTKPNKNRLKNESPTPRDKETLKQTEHSNTVYSTITENDPLDFLNHNLRNLLKSIDNIAFISKTAFLGNFKSNQSKIKQINPETTPQQTKSILYRYLQTTRYFGSTSYAFDQRKLQQIANNIPSFQTDDPDLQFNDQFESSNIYMATRCSEQIMAKYRKQNQLYSRLYFIAMRFDYNTKSYGQWFYFKLKRKEPPFSFSRQMGNHFKFMIINMTKNSSMFGKGLKVSVCRNGIWRKQGINIKYYKNSLKKQEFDNNNIQHTYVTNYKKPQTYYTLEFTLQIYEGQQIYISYNQPYTYTRVGKVIDKMVQQYQSNKRNIIDIKRNIICQTYLNNNVEVLTFTAKNTNLQPEQQQKKVIFIVGRCHPIETAGSHVLQGMLNRLFSLFIQNTLQQQKNDIIYKLLQQYIIKVIPMINPDGVILGNSRCNIAGYDLNRSWRAARSDRVREIYAIKKYVMQYNNRIEMFIDIHAHSKKKNVFAYGCHDISNPYSTRQFPYLLSKLSQNDFLFSQCRFSRMNVVSGQKGSKDGTARVFLYDTLRIPNIFTIQNSYCSAKNSDYHYDKYSYEIIGGDILKAISLYFSPSFKYHHKLSIDTRNKRSPGNMMFKTEADQEEEYQKPSLVKVSLHSSAHQLELTLNLNTCLLTRSEQAVENNVRDLRERYLKELRQKEQNITMGFMKQSASDSEEEERIYEVARRQKDNDDKKGRKNSKTTQKLLNYLQKTRINDNLQKQKGNLQNKKSLMKVSSTHSDTNLVRMSKITNKTRLYTITKAHESTCISLPFQEQETIQKERMTPLKKIYDKPRRKLQDNDTFRASKKDNTISIVQIGLGDNMQIVHDLRLNYAQRMTGKFQFKYPNTNFESTITTRDERANHSPSPSQIPLTRRNREEEIKEYLRKLIRPKQILQRRQKLAGRQKQEKTEIRLKHSNIQFSDLKLSRLTSYRNATERG